MFLKIKNVLFNRIFKFGLSQDKFRNLINSVKTNKGKTLFVSSLILLVIVSFQNCAKISDNPSSPEVSVTSTNPTVTPSITSPPQPTVDPNTPDLTVVSANLNNHILNITGYNLADVYKVTIKGGEVTQELQILNKSKTLVTVATASPILMKVGIVYNLLVSTASASTTASFAYSIENGSITDALLAAGISGTKISGNISGNAANVTGTVGVANGGTGATTFLKNALLLGDGSNPVQALNNLGTEGQILTSTGSLTPPVWKTNMIHTEGDSNFIVGTTWLLGKKNFAGPASLKRLQANPNADSNIGIGYMAAGGTTGSGNVAIGEIALEFNEGGHKNVAIGYSAGHDSTYLGHTNKNGSYNTFIGAETNARAAPATASYMTAIGAGTVVETPNTIVIGRAKAPPFDAVVIGDTKSDDSNYMLQINGSARASSWATSSDERLKKNIEPITNSLDKILSLRAVSFQWKELTADTGKKLGFIAQEVQKVFPELVDDAKKGFLSLNYSGLIAPIVESIQEIFMKSQKQEKELMELKAENEELRLAICELNPHAKICKKPF